MDFQDYGFQFSYASDRLGTHAPNNVNHTYSELLDVVFIKRLCICPFIFKTKVLPPEGSYIRATCVMKNCHIPIERCSRHMIHDVIPAGGFKDKSCFMRCHDASATYEFTADRHASIVFPISSSILEDSTLSGRIENFEFLCYNRCFSDRQKSPLLFVVTLENNYVVLSRQVININISASPGRDMRNWESSTAKANSKSTPNACKCTSKKRKADESSISDSTSQVVSCKYDQMVQGRIREGLEALEVVPKQVIEYYKQLRHQRNGTSTLSSWPVCSACYQTLDIHAGINASVSLEETKELESSMSSSGLTNSISSVRYTLSRRTVCVFALKQNGKSN